MWDIKIESVLGGAPLDGPGVGRASPDAIGFVNRNPRPAPELIAINT